MQKFEVAIIGAGLVGLATAHKLLARNPKLRVAVLEKEKNVAAHQSSHNSGVIHSGIYYKPGSQKALNCASGYAQLLRFCKENEVAHDVCGKIIVATEESERPILDKILQNGLANGLAGIRKISAGEAREIEPHVRASEAIWVPQAGIVDFPGVAARLKNLIQLAGGQVFTGEKVRQVLLSKNGGGCTVVSENGEFQTKLLINCAGLQADKIAEMTMPNHGLQMLPFRGEFYELKPDRQFLVRNLIYPVPNPNFPFLGVHFTRMVRGGIEAGPNAVLAFRREGYSRWQLHFGELAETLAFPGFQKIARKYWRDGWMEMRRSYSKSLFVKALQKLVPEIRPEDVERGRAGVRAMACDRAGNLVDDFLVLQKPGVINVLNAPSPAATACLAIGDFVSGLAFEQSV